eukprot:2491304-Pyramimonas_sp.AAC.1
MQQGCRIFLARQVRSIRCRQGRRRQLRRTHPDQTHGLELERRGGKYQASVGRAVRQACYLPEEPHARGSPDAAPRVAGQDVARYGCTHP